MSGPLVAVVPARGGSKRFPNKNMLRLGGRSLVELAVDCGLEAEGIDRVLIDTDSPELRRLGMAAGAESPYLRPKHLAGDEVQTALVLLNLLDYLSVREGYEPEGFVVLQPTSPLRTSSDVSRGVRLWRANPHVPLASVCKPLQDPRDLLVRDHFGSWEYALQKGPDDQFVFEDGAVYITPVKYLRATGKVFRPAEGRTFEISALRGIDVDEPFQFQAAAAVFLALSTRAETGGD